MNLGDSQNKGTKYSLKKSEEDCSEGPSADLLIPCARDPKDIEIRDDID